MEVKGWKVFAAGTVPLFVKWGKQYFISWWWQFIKKPGPHYVCDGHCCSRPSVVPRAGFQRWKLNSGSLELNKRDQVVGGMEPWGQSSYSIDGLWAEGTECKSQYVRKIHITAGLQNRAEHFLHLQKISWSRSCVRQCWTQAQAACTVGLSAERKPWSVASANFHGVNAPIMANFKLSTWCRSAHRISERIVIGP